ncbi:MAG: hypothetical protein ACOC2H_02725 [Spirochaetota bacterium]
MTHEIGFSYRLWLSHASHRHRSRVRDAVDAEWAQRAEAAEAEQMSGPALTLADMSDAELQQFYDTAGQMAANGSDVPMGNFADPQATQAIKDAIIAEQLKRQGITIGNSDYLNAIADGGGGQLVDEITVIPGRASDNNDDNL